MTGLFSLKSYRVNKILPFLLTISLLQLYACETQEDDPVLMDHAILEWQGSYAACGCGFFIIINEEEYKPKNEEIIDSSFMRSGDISVTIEYEILNETIEKWCFDGIEPSVSQGMWLHSVKGR